VAVSNSFIVRATLKTRDGNTEDGPFLLPPGFDPDNEAFPSLKLYIPQVAGPGVVLGPPSCAVSPNGGNTDFTLEWQAKQDGKTYAVVTVSADHIYPPVDNNVLWASFNRFRQMLEGLPAACLVSGGAGIIANRIAQALPLNYPGTSLFAYGLDSESRYVDLLPGMSLRIDYGTYQYINPSSVVGGNRNAYTGTGSTRFQIRRRADGLIGVNAFTDALSSFQMALGNPPQISGVLDLEARGNNMAYCRLIYPPQIDNVVTIKSAPDASRNVTLIMARTLSDLETATKNYLKDGSCGDVGQCLFFSGRCAAYPEITVLLNGSPVIVPLGTTLKDMIATVITVSIDEVLNGSFQLLFWRWAQPSLLDSDQGWNVGYALTTVQFESTTTVNAATGLTQWDLPLAMGDYIQLSGSK
jgi:hypothetical protein